MQKALDTLHSSSSPQMDENFEAELVNGKGAKRTDYMHGCDADDAPWQILPVEQNVLPSGKRNSTSRVQSRFILSCIGSPLQHFKNLKELLSALRDIVKVHKYLYYEGRMLHRDVHIENVMITSHTDKAMGQLIDMDFVATNRPSSVKKCNNDPVEIKGMTNLIQRLEETNEAFAKYRKHYPGDGLVKALDYIEEVVKFRAEYFDLDVNQVENLKPVDLGWDKETLLISLTIDPERVNE
ncbi:hypothetical protein AX14_013330 [Amanita brunnescens Koide BX004]|nr:hypothetical protein AX14_013330 [Amanita brunnescens Koide BX004]